MTKADAQKKLIALARSQVGYKEGANNFNKYAADPRITRLYGWDVQYQPWCCVFVNWCFMEAFGEETGRQMTCGGSAACSNQADLYRGAGRFVSTPEPGDQIFFNVSGGINHTGIVIEVSGSNVKTVEGNYSDGVGIGSYIMGSPGMGGRTGASPRRSREMLRRSRCPERTRKSRRRSRRAGRSFRSCARATKASRWNGCRRC